MSIGHNVLKLTSSRVATQVIGFATAPIIARLYAPEQFGVLQIFISIAGVIAVITCLRYELSIPLGKDEKEASASFILSVLISLLFSAIVLAVVPFVIEKIAHWFKSPELKQLLWLLPVSIFIGGFRKPLEYWAAREERFGAKAWGGFGASLVSRLIMIGWAIIIGASFAGLFAGYLASMIVSILILLVFLSSKLISDIKNAHLNFGMLWTMTKQHKKFAIYSTWSGLLNSVSVQLPPIILGFYFSTTVVGYYSLGKRLVSLPMGLLGGAIAQVFFPTAAKKYNQTGTLSKIVSNIFKRLVQIGMFPIIMLGFFGAPLFDFVFGEEWFEAGVYTQILSMWTLFVFITSPLSTTFSVLGRQGTGLAFNIGLISSRTIALLLGARMSGPRTTLTAFVIVSVIGWSFLLHWILRHSDVSLKWGLKILFIYGISSFLLLLPAICFAWLWQKNIFIVLASLGLASIVYSYGLYHFDPGIRNFVTNIMNRGLQIKRWNREEKSL